MQIYCMSVAFVPGLYLSLYSFGSSSISIFRLMTGLGYYRFPTGIPFMGIAVCILLCLTVIISASVPVIKSERINLIKVVQIAVLVVLGGVGIYLTSDYQKEQVMAYDYYVRTRQWNKVIDMAEKNILQHLSKLFV